MKRHFLNLIRFFTPELPALSEYEIPEKPRRNIKIDDNRGTRAKVVNGKQHFETVEPDGSIVTEIGKQAPKTANDVIIDKFDAALLDFVVGVKWKKDQQRAMIMKWHWINGHSAKQIESEHTDRQSKQLERGYSERTAAEFIRAFYEADDKRAESNVPRLRKAKDVTIGNVIEW